jgi:hypothetical protein
MPQQPNYNLQPSLMKRTVRAQTPPMPIWLFRKATATGMTQAGSEYRDKATVPWERYRRPISLFFLQKRPATSGKFNRVTTTTG